MSQSGAFAETTAAIRAASAITEGTFVEVGQSLETAIGILASLTSRFEAVLDELGGDDLRQAMNALSVSSAQVSDLVREQSDVTSGFDRMRGLTVAIGARIAQMKLSLRDIDTLALNARIAAANVRGSGIDFATFADGIDETLSIAHLTLDRFSAELEPMHRQLAAAYSGRLAFESRQNTAAHSITDRLSATVKAIGLEYRRAARASLEVKLGGGRIRQRVCDTILALQIGDATRQRQEHSVRALEMTETVGNGVSVLYEHERAWFISLALRLVAAQLSDAALNLDHDTLQIADSLGGLAAEAQRLRDLGCAVHGVAEREDADGGTFIADLEREIREALALMESFETARAEAAQITGAVAVAARRLRGHLVTVQSLEADIRIMGLNTTFRCARIGREGRSLGVIAQSLRTYANGFAREAAALMDEVENVSRIGDLLTLSTRDVGTPGSGGAGTMRASLVALRRMDESLDAAIADLERDSLRVGTLLTEAVTSLSARGEIGRVMYAAALDIETRAPSGPLDPALLGPRVARMIEEIEAAYTMASERAVHRCFLGHAPEEELVSAPPADLEAFLF